MKGDANRIVWVYVDSYVDGIPDGWFQMASSQEAQPFHGICQLLIAINDIFDKEKFPQSFAELRKFHKPSGRTEFSVAAVGQRSGDVATFTLRILFRQNASWQGSVTWIEGNQEEYFRSVLELIVLLDNALSYMKEE